MGFTSNEAVDSSPSFPEQQEPEPAPDEPTPEEVRDYIADEADITAEQVEEEAAAYQDEFKIVGDLAAYYLVGQEHGVNSAEAFETEDTPELEPANLQPGMSDVRITVEIDRITDINEFERDDGSEGKVCNVMFTNGENHAMLTLWDEQTGLKQELSGGDTIRVRNAYTKMTQGYAADVMGYSVDLRLGDDTELERKQDGEWEEVEQRSD